MELTIDQALQQGIAAHKEGKLQDAERLYRSILQVQPGHGDANHMHPERWMSSIIYKQLNDREKCT